VPRDPRPQIPNGLYHVGSRAVDKRIVFHSALEAELFLRLLAVVAKRYGWIVLAYCLMGNHYHIVVITPKPNIARGMQWLNSMFVSEYNRIHGRQGVLVERRYWHRLIEDPADVPFVVSYVLMNPVVGGQCEHPEDYRWSSYRATIGLDPHDGITACDEVLRAVAGTNDGRDLPRAIAVTKFREFVTNQPQNGFTHPDRV
jgi:REP element-mobilizing transposase RayT